MVVFDTATILLSIDPEHARPPIDPTTNLPLTDCKVRVDHLISTLSEARTKVIIPTPVLAEFLVRAGPNKKKFLDLFLTEWPFKVEPFDFRAAVELSELADADTQSGRALTETQTWAKLKFDRQVIAIARVNAATTIYTGDRNLASVATSNSMAATMTWELPLPKGNLPLFPDGETEAGDNASASSSEQPPPS